MKRRNHLLVFLFFSILIAFCASLEAGVSISKRSMTIYVGDTVQLQVEGTRTNTTWTSSNKRIATVSSSGEVKGNSAGNAVITAHAGRESLTCNVTVKKQPVQDETDYQFVDMNIDELISQNSYNYNNDLAGIAAEMSLATYQGDKDSGIRDYLSRMGFDKIYSNNYGGSLAFTLGTKKYTGSGATDNRTYILAIVSQGSTNPYELAADSLSVSSSSYNGYEVHDIVGSFREAISEGLSNIVEDGKKYIVFLTGHSLGGAAVNLLAAQLTDFSSKDFVICYTFGAINSIKVSSPVSDGYENIHNIYNNYDTFAPDHFGSALLNGAGTKYGKFGHLDEYDKEYRSDFDAMKPAPVQIADHINHDMDKYWDAIKNGYVLESKLHTCLNQDSGNGNTHGAVHASQEKRQLFNEVLDQYRSAINAYKNNIDYDVPLGDYVNPYLVNFHVQNPDYETLVYTYYDIDNNGTEELLLGRSTKDKSYIQISDVFSLNGNSIVPLFERGDIGYRADLSVYTDGTMEVFRNQAPTDGIIEVWRIGKDGFSSEQIFKCYYHTGDGSMSLYDAEGEISQEEYEKSVSERSELRVIDWEFLMEDDNQDQKYLAIYEDAMMDAQNRQDTFLQDSGIKYYNNVQYALCDISGDGFKELIVMQRAGKHGVYFWLYGFNGENDTYLGEVLCDPDADSIYGYRQGILYTDSYRKYVSLHIAEWDGNSFTDNTVYEGTKGWDDPPPPVYDLSVFYDTSRLLNKTSDFLPFDDLSILSEYPDSVCIDSLGGTILAHVNSATINVDSCLYDVIDEYRQALTNYDSSWTYEYIESEYPRVNSTMICDAFRFPESTHLFYTFHDIDGNGKDELLIGRGQENKLGIEYIDVFTSDGDSVIRFFDDRSIGYRSFLCIYTDGTIQFSGSGGADHGRVEYWCIGDDGMHPHMILGYKYVYDSDGRHYQDVEGDVDPVEYEAGFEYMDLLELEDWKAIVGEFDSSRNTNEVSTEILQNKKNNDPADNGEYILPNSSTQYLTDSDVVGLDAASLRIARNEIYARHGRRFKSEDLQSYFDGKSWYNGTIAPDDFSESMLSDLEKANIKLIEAHES